MTKVVLPSISLSVPCCTIFSVRVSIDEVASSMISRGVSAIAARRNDGFVAAGFRQNVHHFHRVDDVRGVRSLAHLVSVLYSRKFDRFVNEHIYASEIFYGIDAFYILSVHIIC